MKIFYANEHLACFKCEANKKQTIDYYNLEKEQRFQGTATVNGVLCVLEGDCRVSTDMTRNITINAQHVFFFPIGCRYVIHAKTGFKAVLVRFDPLLELCQNFSLERLLRENRKDIPAVCTLEINESVKGYLYNLINYLQDGLVCSYLMEMKAKELLFIFRGYYTKEELYGFFRPVLNRDQEFATFVHNNWERVKSVKELATLYNLSEASFRKKFKQVFETPAYQWLNDKKAGVIFHEICTTNKSFKELSDEFQFNSVQQLNYFCRKNFNKTPTEVRRSKI